MSVRKSKKRRINVSVAVQRHATLIIVAVLLMLVGGLWLIFRGDRSAGEGALDARLLELAAERGVDSQQIVADASIRKLEGVFVRTWQLEFPNRSARDGFLGDLQIEGAARKGEIELPEDLSSETVTLRMDLGVEAFDLHLRLAPVVAAARPTAVKPPPTPRPTARPEPAPDARGRLAILLDDVGQKYDLVPAAAALPRQVAFAVLPFLPKSAESSTALYDEGHEIWLHLPMEPGNYPEDDPGPGAVLMSMSPDELRTTVHSALNNIPHVVGVNNHMGSKVTADLRTMTWIMQELKVRDMAFIDSRTTIHTVAEDAARGQGVLVNRRHVFLDNERDPTAIRRQLEEAIYRCRLEGEIIAIGHLDRVTIGVLAEDLPGIAARGADLVKPSELVR